MNLFFKIFLGQADGVEVLRWATDCVILDFVSRRMRRVRSAACGARPQNPIGLAFSFLGEKSRFCRAFPPKARYGQALYCGINCDRNFGSILDTARVPSFHR